jgi:2-dehydro-3-deoxyglucarate aldolase
MNKFRQQLLAGDLTLGAWVQIGHPACGEIMAAAGFDWVCVDLEHGAIGLETMTDIFRAMSGFDSVPVARLPANDPIWIHRALDAGARGLIIPMVKTADEAEAAVREAKYPPRGVRGFGYSRANMHGKDFNSYIASSNEEIAMIMQIEHRDAVDHVEEILQVPDVDGLFIGPLDLSGSLGITGKMDHPDMVSALQRFRTACQKHKASAGIHIVRPSETNIQAAIEQGYTLIALGLDNVFLQEGAANCLRAAGR